MPKRSSQQVLAMPMYEVSMKSVSPFFNSKNKAECKRKTFGNRHDKQIFLIIQFWNENWPDGNMNRKLIILCARKVSVVEWIAIGFLFDIFVVLYFDILANRLLLQLVLNWATQLYRIEDWKMFGETKLSNSN